MALQYSGGTIVHTTFTCTTGTRQEIVTGLQTALTSAGWTVTSGGGTGDVIMTSATTPQGLSMSVRLHDPGSGSLARVYARNAAGSIVATSHIPLLTAAGKVYRVNACQYQCFIYTEGSTAAREFGAWGVLYIPSFLTSAITSCIWSCSNTDTESNTTVRPSFRTTLGGLNTSGNEQQPYTFTSLNGNNVNLTGFNTYSRGMIRLVAPTGAIGVKPEDGYRWHDDSLQANEPLVAFGLSATTDEAKIRGQLWNACLLSQGYAPETTITLDGHNWTALTASNDGSGTYGIPKGTLFLATT